MELTFHKSGFFLDPLEFNEILTQQGYKLFLSYDFYQIK